MTDIYCACGGDDLQCQCCNSYVTMGRAVNCLRCSCGEPLHCSTCDAYVSDDNTGTVMFGHFSKFRKSRWGDDE
jgi:hypothetical protein